MYYSSSEYGIGWYGPKWCQSYVGNRQQCVFLLEMDFVQIAKAVPQGSIIGPTLFTLYVDDIISTVTVCNIHLYADDTILYCIANDALSAVNSL